MPVYVIDTKCYYALAADLASWDFLTSNQAELARQPTWVVNGATGSDNNTGLTSLTALATAEELSRRLCPNGQRLDLTVSPVITFQANSGAPLSYGKLMLNVAGATTSSKILRIVSEYASTANISITGVIAANPETNTRHELTSGSALFVANKRIRNTTAGARFGNLAVLSNLNGSASDVFVGTSWVNPNTVSNAAPIIGDTVTVDTPLVTFATVEIITHVNCSVVFADAIVTRLVTQGYSGAGTISNSIFIWGCEPSPVTASNVWVAMTGVVLDSCRFPFDCGWSGNIFILAGCSVQALITAYSQSLVWGPGDSIIDAGRMVVGADHHQVQCNSTISGRVEHENGAELTAWRIASGSELVVANSAWGVGGYDVGIELDPCSHVYSSVGFAPGGLNFGSTTNVLMDSSKAVSFSQCPFGYPLADCSVVAGGSASLPENDAEVNDGNSGAAVAVNFNAGLTHLVTLTANATVTMTAPPAPCTVTLRIVEGGAGGFSLALAGLTVKGYTALTVTTAGAQNVLTMYWTGSQMLITSQVGYS